MTMDNDFKVFAGNSNIELAKKVCDYIGIKLGDIEVGRFEDGEIKVIINENVRGKNVYVIQSTPPPSDNYLELFIILDALKRASTEAISAITPYYGYGRQDRKTRGREPISAKLMANLIVASGATRFIAIDLHAGQIQGFFDIPSDNLSAIPLFADYFINKNLSDIVVVSPDVGGVTRANSLASRLHAPIVIFAKRREKPDEIARMDLVGDVKGKNAIIIDDGIYTGGTLINATKILLDKGAKKVYAAATHGIFCNDSLKKLNDSPLEEIIVTDTLKIKNSEGYEKLKIISVAPLIGEAIKRVQTHSSISELFK
jgi:ribose-phosphate pyrophosphokinase